MQKKTIKVKTLISQKEKNTNPIFKAIYKKIRNLTKKVASIETLAKEDRDNLKPDQILKIEKKHQICEEIVKCQQFAIFYKELLQDKEVASSIINDQLIKIATVFAVCQAVQHDGGSKDKTIQQVLTKIIQPITAEHNPSISIGDKIGENVELFKELLENDKYYTSCRNYISDFPKSSAMQSSKQSEKASSHQNKKKAKKQFEPIQDKIDEKRATLQNDKKHDKQTHGSQQKEKKQKSLEAKKSHSQKKQQQQNKIVKQAKEQTAQHQLITQQKNTNKEQNHGEQKIIQQNNGDDEQDKNIHNNERKNQNRTYRQNRDYNNQYKNYNRTQQYQGKQSNWNKNKQYQERPRKYKARQTAREGSDTSLEPTPDKIKKPKYVQKV